MTSLQSSLLSAGRQEMQRTLVSLKDTDVSPKFGLVGLQLSGESVSAERNIQDKDLGSKKAESMGRGSEGECGRLMGPKVLWGPAMGSGALHISQRKWIREPSRE